MSKVKYTCKNCGWETSIREEWGDLRPKRCMNKKCNTSFMARPDMLVIERPEPKSEQTVEVVLSEEEKSEEKRHGRKKR